MRPVLYGLLALSLCAFATCVSANVPPANWQPPTFEGPGLLCGAGLTFALESGETATAGFPSEGAEPIYIRSHGGNFSIVSHEFDAMQVEKTAISSTPNGSIYLVTNVARASSSGVPRRRMYWFQPTTGVPFSIDFYTAVPGRGGWDEFPPTDYDEVLRRVMFASPEQQMACLKPKA